MTFHMSRLRSWASPQEFYKGREKVLEKPDGDKRQSQTNHVPHQFFVCFFNYNKQAKLQSTPPDFSQFFLFSIKKHYL